MQEKINVFWFRRDLRLHDNRALFQALTSGLKVLPLFIFDTNILHKLDDKSDPRVGFIHSCLTNINKELEAYESSLIVKLGKPQQVFEEIILQWDVQAVFANKDFEPYAVERDQEVNKMLLSKGIQFSMFTDHLIFEPGQVLKADDTPYTVYTPFSKKWKSLFDLHMVDPFPSETKKDRFVRQKYELDNLKYFGFENPTIEVPSPIIAAKHLSEYAENRNFPAIQGTSLAGPHLRFGTISIRELIRSTYYSSEVYLNELIWREFFTHILYFFPNSAKENFNSKYNPLEWRNNEDDFQKWCEGKTGYPMVDAGMRELNATGTMHNRVRMVVASFLTKHLLIDWRWGEIYFASKLLDFEMASNVGNWQWAAGTGCDAAPYFRVFNPSEQLRKFDPERKYVTKWVPEINDLSYLSSQIVEHRFARDRALSTYKKALGV